MDYRKTEKCCAHLPVQNGRLGDRFTVAVFLRQIFGVKVEINDWMVVFLAKSRFPVDKQMSGIIKPRDKESRALRAGLIDNTHGV